MTKIIIFMSGGVIHSISADGKRVEAFIVDEDKEGASDRNYRLLRWPQDKKGQEIGRVAFEWGRVEVSKRTVRTLSDQIKDDRTLATFCQKCLADFFTLDMVMENDGDNFTCKKCLATPQAEEPKPIKIKKI